MFQGIAFDRASARSITADGRLQVASSHLTIEQVADYLGREIPNWRELNLDPDKIYKLYRSAEEIEKAAQTFNSLPILTEHVPVTVDDHRPDLVVGATGTDAVFKAPYLDNSLVLWAQHAIDLVESGDQKELSCAYRYRLVMEPGEFNGQPYDGRMVDLIGNHVALVAAGRAGPTVVVSDSLPKELQDMSKKIPSRMALLARGALMALGFAADAKAVVDKALVDVTAKNWKERKPAIIAAVKPKLAQDADIGNLVKLLDGLDAEAGEGGMGADDPQATETPPSNVDQNLDALDADPCKDLLAMLAGKLSPEDLAAFEAKLRAALAPPAADGDPADKPPADNAGAPVTPAAKKDDMITKTAMDAAIKAATEGAVKQATADARRIAREITEAEKVVRPYVGEIAVAQDSAEGVYKAALEMLEIDVKDIHPSAYRAVLQAQPKPNADHEVKPASLALDSRTEISKTYPGIARIRVHG